jgi:hypothetical protein
MSSVKSVTHVPGCTGSPKAIRGGSRGGAAAVGDAECAVAPKCPLRGLPAAPEVGLADFGTVKGPKSKRPISSWQPSPSL